MSEKVDKIGSFGASDVLVITLIAIAAGTGIVFTVKQIKKNNERKKQIASVLSITGEANPKKDHFFCAANACRTNKDKRVTGKNVLDVNYKKQKIY